MLTMTPPTPEAPPQETKHMTNEEYHAHPAISSTDLKLLEESSAHLENKVLFKYTTDSMDFGTLVHTLTLEPHNFDNEFLVQPVGAKRNTTIGKQKWEMHEADLSGRISIAQGDVAKAWRMAQNATTIINKLLMVDDFLQIGRAEETHILTDQNTGLQIKCRPDFLTNSDILLDIKTIADISTRGIKKAVTEYNYPRSLAFYKHVLGQKGRRIKRAALVFIESSNGHMVKVRFFDANTDANSTIEVQELLGAHAAYVAGGSFSIAHEVTPYEKGN